MMIVNICRANVDRHDEVGMASHYVIYKRIIYNYAKYYWHKPGIERENMKTCSF